MQAVDPNTPLTRDDFTLVGFDNLLSPLDQMLSRIEIRRTEPQSPLIIDAVFVPAMKVGHQRFEGALLTAGGQPIPQARSQRRNGRRGDVTLGALSEPVELHPEQTIEDEVVYLGWCFDHFGHFLLESLARTWVLPRLDPDLKLVFHREQPNPLSVTTQRMLELLGVTPDRILFLDRQTRLRRVIVPEPLYEISHAVHTGLTRPYHQITGAVLGDDTGDTSDRPLYLSRRLLSSRQRRIIGEFELEEVCRENGFIVAHPETMSLDDQVRLVNRHRQIFTSDGSAAYLLLFVLKPGRLHLLTNDLPFADYFMTPKAASIPASFVNCLAGGNRQSNRIFHLPQMVELDVFASYLEAQGMLHRTPRSSLLNRDADFQAAYDEAWFYRYARRGRRTSVLPEAMEAEAMSVATSSWVLSWTLAWYYSAHNPRQIDPLLRQFAALATAETSVDRLMQYRQDIIASVAQLLRRCSPQTAQLVWNVLADRFLISESEVPKRRGRRQRR